MSNHSHVNAPTCRIDANGISYAYRRFGKGTGVPLIFLQHFRGGLDHWDPLITDGFAKDRPVILFDNAGVAGSSGETPDTVEAMADHLARFTGALQLSTIDVRGFSIGGYIAQAFTLRYPALVRRIILIGTMPRSGCSTPSSQFRTSMITSRYFSYPPRRAWRPGVPSGSVGIGARSTLIRRRQSKP